MVRMDYDTKAYWDGCAQQRLVIAQCSDCARWIHPPKSVCPECWSTSITHREVPGDATVYTYTIVGQRESDPRATLWAKLNVSGVLVLGELVSDPSAIAIGDQLDLTWQEVEDGFVPAFRKKGS